MGSLSPSAAVALTVISKILGWAYFFCWSFSFYPQAYLNFHNKSVTGLSVDFVVASFVGFLCYAIFACSFYWNGPIQATYESRHDGQENLVELNDVIFTVHASAITFVYLIQVIVYRKPDEKMSKIEMASMSAIGVGTAIALLLSILGVMAWLDFLYLLSYIKLGLTIVKYIPQVYMNYQRKSTTGWSIINVMLDFAGGVFSIMQLILDSWISGSWSGITGILIKLALGVVTLFFDTIFLLQHYVWYRPGRGPHLVEMAEAHEDHGLEPKGDGALKTLASPFSEELKKMEDGLRPEDDLPPPYESPKKDL